ncbi:hypothetical protein [Flavobacterium granuli]|uniref:Uncharacterized protein n=1 Tax=Flavobacterium granuli TaxID=280093 RepID=A0ABU1S237_9FLAO|nr:hypothetical protein [Flavobacterium granuli]MDR6845096.1 hypothetical protein [Flavobacterium granuli]
MLENRFKSVNFIKPFATYLFCLLSYGSFSQSTEKQTILVEKMEYAYNSSITVSSNEFDSFSDSRVILATDPEIADKMKQSILTAISNRWNATILNPQWDLKRLGDFNKHPKFKTDLKKGTPGSWHLFLQVFDNGPYPITDKGSSLFNTYPAFKSLDYAPYYLQFKVSIVDGSNKAVIFSNEMMVEMQRAPLPAGQLLFRKLPAHTDSFLQAFDTVAQTLFAVNPQRELKLEVTPACLFLDTDKTLANAKKLNFVSKNDSIIELIQLKQEWIIQNTKTRKTKRKNNFGNNLFNSTFTSLTGLNTDKIRAMGYITKFGFIDTNDNTHYFCEIPFIEETREEKESEVTKEADGYKSYSNNLNGNIKVNRSINPEQMCYLIREKDTVGYFKLKKGDRIGSKNNLSQFWDGKNESSIKKTPDFWNNSESSISPYFLDGELNKVHFIIENGKGGNQTDIKISGQEIMTLKIYNDKPVFGLLYSNPPDEKTLSILLMLSTMPFGSML